MFLMVSADLSDEFCRKAIGKHAGETVTVCLLERLGDPPRAA